MSRGLLAPGQATHLRRMTTRTLPDTCDIVRDTYTQGEGGGQTETETTIATGVRCRYSEELGQRDLARAEALGTRIDGRATLPALTDVTAADKLANLTVDGVNLGTFEVKEVRRRSEELVRVALVVKV